MHSKPVLSLVSNEFYLFEVFFVLFSKLYFGDQYNCWTVADLRYLFADALKPGAEYLPLSIAGSKFIIYPFLFGQIIYLPLFYWIKFKIFPLFYWVKIHNLTIFIGSIFKNPLFLGWWSKFTPFYWTKIKISPFLLGQYLVNVARFARELSISL